MTRFAIKSFVMKIFKPSVYVLCLSVILLQVFSFFEDSSTKKMKIPKAHQGVFQFFLEDLELFTATDFLAEEYENNTLHDVKIIGALSRFEYAKDIILWPNLLIPQKIALQNLIQALKEYFESEYDVNTEYQKWDSLKPYVKDVYQSFIKHVPTGLERKVIHEKMKYPTHSIYNDTGLVHTIETGRGPEGFEKLC